MKINGFIDPFLDPSSTRPARFTPPPSTPGIADQTGSSITASNINDGLNSIADSRAAHVQQLAALYANGRYTVDSTTLAQTLVSSALTSR